MCMFKCSKLLLDKDVWTCALKKKISRQRIDKIYKRCSKNKIKRCIMRIMVVKQATW